MLLAIALCLLAGASAGFFGGLLGIGGGLLVVAALSLTLPTLGVPKAAVMHVSVATSMATMVLTFASSAAAHIRRGSVVWPSWTWLAPSMVIGGFAGAHLAQVLSAQTLRWTIAHRTRTRPSTCPARLRSCPPAPRSARSRRW
jgi:uncharacterized membrane protein YfcA